MPIELTDKIVPMGNFPVVEDINLYGGYQVVLNVAARDAIPSSNRKAGMLVCTQEDDNLWRLDDSLTTWTLFTGAVSRGTRVDTDANDIAIFTFDESSSSTTTFVNTGTEAGNLTSNGVSRVIPAIGGKFGNSIYLSDDPLISSPMGVWQPQNLTTSFWVYITDYIGDGNYGRVLYKAHNDNWVQPWASVRTLEFDTDLGSGFAEVITVGGASKKVSFLEGDFPKNSWVHYGITYDGTYLKLYINGQLYGTSVGSTAGAIDWGQGRPWYLGKVFTQIFHEWAKCYLDDLRIANVVRPESWFLDVYTRGRDSRASNVTTCLQSLTSTVDISEAQAPSVGQVLTATSGTAATWQDPAGSSTATGLLTATTTVGVSAATAPSSGQILTATSSTAATWQTPTVYPSLTATAPVDLTKATAAVGVATTAARSDHKHDVSTAASGAATPGDSAAEGTATSLARSDHKHSLPAFGTASGTFTQGNDSRLSDDRTASGIRTGSTVVGVSSATAPSSGQVLTATSSTAATWQTPSGGGSTATGIQTATTVVGVSSATAPSSGQVLTATSTTAATWQTPTVYANVTSTAPEDITKAVAAVGVATTAARSDHKHDVSTAASGAATPGDSAAEGTATSLARSDHKHSLPAFGTTGTTFCVGNDSRLSDDRTASGLRTGSTVVAISSATAPSSGQVLTATSTTAATWQTPTGGGGTATGIQTATTVVAVSTATAPSSGQVLTATSSTAATWQTPVSTLRGVTSVTSNYQVLASDDLIAVGARSSVIEVTLTAAPVTGESHSIKDASGQSNTYSITLEGNGKTIDGNTTLSIADNYACITVIYNDTQWSIV